MRAILVISLLSLGLVGMSCKGDDEAAEAPSTRPVTTATTSGSPRKGRTGAAWALFGETVGKVDPGTEPLVEALAVFSQPAGDKDEFPRSGMPPSDVTAGQRFEWGHQLFGESRLLIENFSVDGMKFYGVPTDRGWVCLYLLSREDELISGGGCDRGLSRGVTYHVSGDDGRWRVFGLAADDAREVLVVSGDTGFVASKGRNAFFFGSLVKKLCPVDVDELQVLPAKPSRHVPLAMGHSRAEYGCSR